ncbi:MAG: hypothetical protein K6G09_07755 [Treponema sp.]|nr:hypothetical protein [Treponema sp.]
MNQQDTLILRGLELKLDRIIDFLSNSKKNNDNEEKTKEMELGEWVTLTQAWKLQGVFSLQTIRARPDLQPCLGQGTMIGKNKCFPKAAVLEWLNAVTPEQRKAYKLKYSGGKQ